MAEGGRGGGKTHAMARLVLYVASKRLMRIVCGRELQTNIGESVYSILVDLINTHNLNFEIFATKIIHKETKSTINFRGFRERGSFNIQGLENISLLWIDEGQAITKATLDILIPTIRRDDARIFFTMNRHVEADPVYDFCVNRDDCLKIHINYFDNSFCTEALKKEAVECKKKSLSDYNHIWLGEPLSQSEDTLFSRQELLNLTRPPLQPGYGMRVIGFDIARYGDDKSAAVVLQQQNLLHWEVIHVEEWEKRDLNYTTGRILKIHNKYQAERSIIDEDGMGSGPLDSLVHGRGLNSFTGFRNHSISYADNKSFVNPRTVNAYKLKDLVSKGYIHVSNKDLIKELCSLRFNYDHTQRRILISKEKMKQMHVKSQNLADALIYAVSLISKVKEVQEVQYRPSQPQYSNQPWNPWQDDGWTL